MLNVICLQDEALYELVEQVLNRMLLNHNTTEPEFISTDACMKMLNIASKTTLQKLRDEGKIAYTQPSKKIILYRRSSILEYLKSHEHHIF